MRAMRGQQILQTLGILQIVEQGHGPHFRMAAVELGLDLVEIEFAMVQQHQFGGTSGGDLTAQFSADRTTRPGHQDRPSGKHRPHGFRIQFARRPWQQVFEPQVAQTQAAAAHINTDYTSRHGHLQLGRRGRWCVRSHRAGR